MSHTRFSVSQDREALRQLWQLVFEDSDTFLDHFFQEHYDPQHALVLEEDGTLQAMAFWFETQLMVPGIQPVKAAYLYAVATHPDFRGKGLARQLLDESAQLLRDLGCELMTLVPSEPTLHLFYQDRGFHECFVNAEYEMTPAKPPFQLPGISLEQVDPQTYTDVREQLLNGTPRLSYSTAAMAYQEGCCKLSGGGLYVGRTPAGPVCLTLERSPENMMLAKELLGSHDALMFMSGEFYKLAPNLRWSVRCPVGFATPDASVKKFGMLRWLDPVVAENWDYESTAYLGLAFD